MVLDRHVLPLDVAGFVEALTERIAPETNGLPRVHVADDWHRRLLCPRGKRPRSSAADERDELAPLNHSITSSARAESVGGTSMPSTFAVLRLMTNSNLVVCTVGSSVVLAPLRMRPV